MAKVDFYLHSLGDEELAGVGEVLGSVFLTTGPKTAELERRLAAYLGAQHVVGVTSCTAALFLCLKAFDVGPGDEVVTTPMSFIATANTILHAGATPVFVDVEPDTGNLDLAKLEAALTPRTKAIIPVHLYGQMLDMRRLMALARPRGIAVIEDSAHALESTRDGVRPGQLGDASCLSFYATKNLTCGEGGAVATSRADVAQRLRLLRLHGMSKEAYERYTARYQHYDMVELGYKANMFDLQAALLLPQLARIEERLLRREALCGRYEAAVRELPGVELPARRPNGTHARHLFTIWVERRDEVLTALQDAGIGVAVNFRAIHLMKYYRERFGFARGAFPNAERIGDRTITLPLYPRLREAQVDEAVAALRAALETGS